MSGRYWLSAIALIGLIAVAAISWPLYERYEYRESRYQAALQQYEDSKRHQPPGVVLDKQSSKPDPKSYREEWRSEQDLQAQREMAEWSFYMLVASVFGIVVGAAGVIFVAFTLKATRDAVKEAQRTVNLMAGAERAYVKMSHVTPKDSMALSFSGHIAKVTIEITNHGRTPATVTAVHIQLDRFGSDKEIPADPIYRKDPAYKYFGAFLVANDTVVVSPQLRTPDGEGGVLWLYGYVDYTDEFGAHHRGGYARYHREPPRLGEFPRKHNNLAFVEKAHWNYDSRRPPYGENKDKKNRD